MEQLHDPLVHIHDILLTEEKLPLLLDEHRVAFVLPDFKLVPLLQRLRKSRVVFFTTFSFTLISVLPSS